MSKSFSSNRSIRKKDTITILSAAEFEFTHLKERILGSKLLTKKYRFKFVTIGIGPIAAAKSISKLKKDCENAHVIALGTCGEIHSSKHMLKLMNIQSAKWLPWDVRNKKSYLVEKFYPSYKLKKSWAIFRSFEKATLCSSSSITNSKEIEFQESTAETFVENLEIYSLLPEVYSWSKTFTPLLMVTNQTGKFAHSQWKKNYLKAAKLSGDQIYQILEKNIN